VPAPRCRRGRRRRATNAPPRTPLPRPHPAGAYAASKHALRVVSHTLQLELAPYGVSVMDVGLGFTATPLLGKGVDCMAAAAAAAEGAGPAGSRLSAARAAAMRAQAAAVAAAAPVEGVAAAVADAALRPGGPPHQLLLGSGAWLAWAASWAPAWALQLAYGAALGLLPCRWRLPVPRAARRAAAGAAAWAAALTRRRKALAAL
jgi:hypothetical protein